jgi:hypothetical protein
VQENGDAHLTKVGHLQLFSSIPCTNHAIGTPGGKNERNEDETHRFR